MLPTLCQQRWRQRDNAPLAVVAACQRNVGGSMAAARRRRQRQQRWRQREARQRGTARRRQREVRWQQHGSCGGFTDTVRECAYARAFKRHQRADVRVFVLGQGRRDDSVEDIVVVCSNSAAHGDVHRGRRCAAADDADADGDGDDIVC